MAALPRIGKSAKRVYVWSNVPADSGYPLANARRAAAGDVYNEELCLGDRQERVCVTSILLDGVV